MDHYNFLLLRLKAMESQGFPKQKCLDEWRLHKPMIIVELEKSLMLAILKDDEVSKSEIKEKIKRIQNLNKEIEIGLFEDQNS